MNRWLACLCCLLSCLLLAGCGRTGSPAQLSDLADLLGSALPADARLLAGERRETTSSWFVQSASQLSGPRSGTVAVPPTAESPIPAGVLAGLLAQHELPSSDPAVADIPGVLRDWSLPEGLLRYREFHSGNDWFTVVEFHRADKPQAGR